MSRYFQSFLKGPHQARVWRGSVMGVVLLVVVFRATPSPAQKGTPIRVDASEAFQEPAPALYDEGSAKSPSGRTLGVNGRYLTLDGQPWLPVMGEFQFSRYPEAQWEEEILKMKASGVNIVAAYVIWIHHEEIEGQFDWSGRRDLRAFVQLCARHGMYVEARIGPWDHGEVRNGGFPDWIVKQGPTRVNDPAYLASVRSWFQQVGRQLDGLLWKDGGPVLGIQLENEYSKRGPGAGEAHILELKKIAIESGLDVPLYLVTGWDNAAVPRRAVLPVYGGYPDAPWDGSIAKLPAPEVYAFRFKSRVAANMGAIDINGASRGKSAVPDAVPYLSAEIGGGVEDTYHRRPVIEPDDIGAMVPVMLGSGVNLYGTYMFQGGENPDGKLTTLEESQATGYPNDLPLKSYDFQAPLGEFGQERASFRKLKVFQYFLNDFGSSLAPMVVHAPDQLPRNPQDLSVPRASVRSNGDAGFIFMNNYVRGYPMPPRPAVQFQIVLPNGALKVPQHPVDIPSGSYFIWPFNFRIAGMTLRYSTAQVFTRLSAPAGKDGSTTVVFSSVRGIPVEFAFDAQTVRSLKASSGETKQDSGTLYVTGVEPGLDSSIDLVSNLGQTLRLVVLSAQQAEDAWKVRVGGEDRLLLSSQDFFADGDSQPARIWLRSRQSPRFEFTITPPLAAAPQASLELTKVASGTHAMRFSAEAETRNPKLQCHLVQAAGDALPVRLGPRMDARRPRVAQAPAESELPNAAKWSIAIPPGALDGLSELFLQIKYQGDVARLYSAHRLLTDDFYNGLPWSIGLRRFMDIQHADGFELSILPLRKDVPVYFEFHKHPQFSDKGQAIELEDLQLVPEYQLVIDAGGQ